MLKGGGIGAAIFGGGMAVAAVALPLAVLVTAPIAAIFKLGKALTVDLASGIKSDKELEVAKNEILKKYKGLNISEVGDLISRYYNETSKGKTYSVLTHK